MTEDNSWESSLPGTISDVVDEKARHERLWKMSRRAVIGGTLATAAGAMLIVYDRLRPGAHYMCADALALADDYVAGRLEAARVKLIDQHRTRCDSCDAKLKQLQSDWNRSDRAP